ncbi:hypothetical protein VOLCADRAFT_105190 [Volvox carteri f. nagariensis]|uniref:Uncharacterized protein n=1 Tax=Volvox carteri f. nagariensis TaxID=3068 RepID=D8TZ52_VOLCA|nr:uncharacterized protein VOLCADRAFT_105190 [Volvox carteri f. nagariensis]EFJ47216.1 hypothetical protein VOLCADRAFT_105190 [Volvox carteri f. nagariensis]|eukprot:XP_002951765.1 hypothetical protein VOLCADRAFT_105190 [Volvox carteri f. nagariensis]
MVADSEYGNGNGSTAATGGGTVSGGGLGSGSGGMSKSNNKRSRCDLEPSGVEAVAVALLKGQGPQQSAPTSLFATNPPGAGGASGGGGGGGSSSGLTNYDAAGNLLPAGITRPLPQHLGGTTAALLSEMAGQLGRISALAREVEGLKEENTALKRSMEALTEAYGNVRLLGGDGGGCGGGSGPVGATPSGPAGDVTGDGLAGGDGVGFLPYDGDGVADGGAAASGASEGAAGGSTGSGPLEGTSAAGAAGTGAAAAGAAPTAGPVANVMPLSQAVEVQQKRIWDQKLRHDDLEKQLQAQREVSAVQAAKTAALEAALAANTAKAVHDAAMFGRVLEERVTAQSEVVRDRLEAQERANKVAQDVNQRLEARVAELEAQLSGGIQRRVTPVPQLGHQRATSNLFGMCMVVISTVDPPVSVVGPPHFWMVRPLLTSPPAEEIPGSNRAISASSCMVTRWARIRVEARLWSPPPVPSNLPVNNCNNNNNNNNLNPCNRQPPLDWPDAAALGVRAIHHQGAGAQVPAHGSVAIADGSGDLAAAPGVPDGELGAPGLQQRLMLAFSPEAELYAKSIEDRLWGTVEQIVNSADSPADGASVGRATRAGPEVAAAKAGMFHDPYGTGANDGGGHYNGTQAFSEHNAVRWEAAEGANSREGSGSCPPPPVPPPVPLPMPPSVGCGGSGVVVNQHASEAAAAAVVVSRAAVATTTGTATVAAAAAAGEVVDGEHSGVAAPQWNEHADSDHMDMGV